MSQSKSKRRQTRRTEPTTITPARRRSASELLGKMPALDHAGEHPVIDLARERLREQAAVMGMRFVGFTVTEAPIPDPALDALPRADYERIAKISREMYSRPQVHVAELERLVAKHPHIPMLRNHLAGALEAAGKRERAESLIEQTAKEFPTYFFAFCNHVLFLIADRRIDEARARVETGPRGPVFTLTDFDSTRDTFHISEAVSHAAMVGRYMLATGRREAAEVQLKMLSELAPQSPQYHCLASAMSREEDHIGFAAALLLKKAVSGLREELGAAKTRKQVKRPRKKPSIQQASTDKLSDGAPVVREPEPQLFQP